MYKAQQFELIFDAIELTVSHDSNVDDIVVIYNLTRKLRSYEHGK